MPDQSFQLPYDVVVLLDGITQKKGHGDLAAYLSQDPREALAFLRHALTTIAEGGSVKTRAPEGSTSTNDPALARQLLGTFSTDYAGKTVEVKLQKKKFGGYKTLTLEVPPAQ